MANTLRRPSNRAFATLQNEPPRWNNDRLTTILTFWPPPHFLQIWVGQECHLRSETESIQKIGKSKFCTRETNEVVVTLLVRGIHHSHGSGCYRIEATYDARSCLGGTNKTINNMKINLEPTFSNLCIYWNNQYFTRFDSVFQFFQFPSIQFCCSRRSKPSDPNEAEKNIIFVSINRSMTFGFEDWKQFALFMTLGNESQFFFNYSLCSIVRSIDARTHHLSHTLTWMILFVYQFHSILEKNKRLRLHHWIIIITRY